MNNFSKILDNINVVPLLQQIESYPELWNQYTLRTTHPGTAHKDASDIWLRFNKIWVYPTDELNKIMDDLDCVDYPAYGDLTEARHIVETLMFAVDAKEIGRIIITKLPPGGKITPHIDEGKYARNYNRFHVALVNNPGSVFWCGQEMRTFKPGEIWQFDTSKEHEVINRSNQDRITLIVDLK